MGKHGAPQSDPEDLMRLLDRKVFEGGVYAGAAAPLDYGQLGVGHGFGPFAFSAANRLMVSSAIWPSSYSLYGSMSRSYLATPILLGSSTAPPRPRL